MEKKEKDCSECRYQRTIICKNRCNDKEMWEKLLQVNKEETKDEDIRHRD